MVRTNASAHRMPKGGDLEKWCNSSYPRYVWLDNVTQQRLFDPVNIVWSKHVDSAGGLVQIPTLIGVNHQTAIWSDDRSDKLASLHVLLKRGVTDFNFNTSIACLNPASGLIGKSIEIIVVVDAAAVSRNRRAARPEILRKRHSTTTKHQIPQCRVDRRYC